MSWVMRIQNQNSSLDLSDVPTLFLPSLMKKETMSSNHSGTTASSRSDANDTDVSFLFLSIHFTKLICEDCLLFMNVYFFTDSGVNISSC